MATNREPERDRAVVEDPGTPRNNMHENRETSSASVDQADRSAKAQSHNADMHAMEESDRGIVPMKQPNKEGQPSAEVGREGGRPRRTTRNPAPSRHRAGNECPKD